MALNAIKAGTPHTVMSGPLSRLTTTDCPRARDRPTIGDGASSPAWLSALEGHRHSLVCLRRGLFGHGVASPGAPDSSPRALAVACSLLPRSRARIAATRCPAAWQESDGPAKSAPAEGRPPGVDRAGRRSHRHMGQRAQRRSHGSTQALQNTWPQGSRRGSSAQPARQMAHSRASEDDPDALAAHSAVAWEISCCEKPFATFFSPRESSTVFKPSSTDGRRIRACDAVRLVVLVWQDLHSSAYADTRLARAPPTTLGVRRWETAPGDSIASDALDGS